MKVAKVSIWPKIKHQSPWPAFQTAIHNIRLITSFAILRMSMISDVSQIHLIGYSSSYRQPARVTDAVQSSSAYRVVPSSFFKNNVTKTRVQHKESNCSAFNSDQMGRNEVDLLKFAEQPLKRCKTTCNRSFQLNESISGSNGEK